MTQQDTAEQRGGEGGGGGGGGCCIQVEYCTVLGQIVCTVSLLGRDEG